MDIFVSMTNKGYIHIYTGNGKGKTTAAFGLAIRALCAGKKIYIGQFVKSMKYNETRIADFFANITIEQLGRGCFLDHNPQQIDCDMAQNALLKCTEIMASGKYDLVILDELTIAIYFGLLSEQQVVEAIEKRNPATEIVITGRYAPQSLIDIADLVTDMQEVKHYYTQGVLSRNGIDR